MEMSISRPGCLFRYLPANVHEEMTERRSEKMDSPTQDTAISLRGLSGRSGDVMVCQDERSPKVTSSEM
jgi:hypothetical protein